MARVENDTSDSDESDGKLSIDGDEAEANKDVEKDDSDDESITSEDEDDNSLELKVSAVEERILKNPYIYMNHVELISILQQLQNPSRLRSAYERLSNLCPLAPKQWLSWLQLEVSAASTPDDRKQLYKLFDMAFVDCYSASIYLEWCAMSMGGSDGETDPRTVIAQALEAAGSDPMDGSMIWDMAKEFELSHLSLLSATSDDYPIQVMRIFDLFSNQLSRPLLQPDKTIEEFRSFAESMQAYIPDTEDVVKKVENAHKVSEEVLKKFFEFENELEVVEEDEKEEVQMKQKIYSEYISHVKTLLDVKELDTCDLTNLLGALYDRATTECCAPSCRTEVIMSEESERLAIDYIEHTREYGSDEQCLNVIEKVIKRCPRKSCLWIMKLNQLERIGKDIDQIKQEFETSLFMGFDNAVDHVAVWMCYLETLRRHTDFGSSQEVERLRKTFRLSWESLGQMWGDTADTEFSILQFWARIEYQHTKDFEYGKELFEEIFEYGDNRLHGGLWLEFVSMERLRGGPNRARSVLRRAVRNSTDPRLQRAWLSLERDHGTLDSITECTRVCAEKAKEWEETRARNQSEGYSNYRNKSSHNSKFQPKNKDEPFAKNKKKKKGKANQETANSSPQKNVTKRSHQDLQSENSGSNSKAAGSAASNNSKQLISNSKKRKFDSANGDVDSEKTDIESSNNDKVTRNSAKRKSFDQKDSDLPVKKQKVEAGGSGKSSGAPPPGYEAFRNQEPKFSETGDEERDSRTAFISNLDFNVDEDHLRGKLSEYGTIDELRLVKGVKTFGSICYCVYKDTDSVNKALLHDRVPLGNRPMFISRYCPTKDTRKKHFVYPTGIERNKLFVKNIAFDHCTDKALRDVFQKYGELKDIRIVTYKTGNPKGLAYIEYVDEKSASAALRGADELDVGGRPLSVAFSAPPARKADPINISASLGQASASRGAARTQLSFVPRVLQKIVVSSVDSGASGDNSDAPPPAKMSNNDFRSMLLGNK